MRKIIEQKLIEGEEYNSKESLHIDALDYRDLYLGKNSPSSRYALEKEGLYFHSKIGYQIFTGSDLYYYPEFEKKYPLNLKKR
jgi:hypothetical protein